jgi:hypothetical protein
MFSDHIVFVLVKKIVGLICDLSSRKFFQSPWWYISNYHYHQTNSYISCVVVDCESSPGKFGLAEALMWFVCLIHLLCECLMSGLWKHAVSWINIHQILTFTFTLHARKKYPMLFLRGKCQRMFSLLKVHFVHITRSRRIRKSKQYSFLCQSCPYHASSRRAIIPPGFCMKYSSVID